MAENELMRGTVKWFSAQRGFGFITDDDGVDCYVHFTNINMEGFKKLLPGQRVTFLSDEDAHGRASAKEVTVMEE